MGYCPKCGEVMDRCNPQFTPDGKIITDSNGRPVTNGNHTGLRTVGGAAAGAAIGSVVPIVGSVLGGVIGGVAGFISGVCKDDKECTKDGKTIVVYICPKCHYWFSKKL